ncbi:DUF3168 domain-containing protein [Pelagibacterium halotolerans]|uniref:DUF3168 domain-containing protein n=1 Tax=Pelagibacterium halotolerans TaxID=531813 RepID=UPI00385173A8
MSAGLAAQKALRARLVGTTAVTNLVPAANILDRNSRPNPDPSIIIGEGQELEGDDIARTNRNIIFDMHVWKKELSLVGVKTIAGAMRTAIHSARLQLEAGFHCGDCHVIGMRYLRDPDGETSHAVVTVSAMVGEVSS